MTVSIIIPAYNAAPFLADAIQSCLDQTHPPTQILVINDGSTDETPAIARRYESVTCIDQENRGLAGARNTGITHAIGEYIQFLDADDVLLPTKIQRCLAGFAADPDASLVYTDYEVRSADLRQSANQFKPDLERRSGYLVEYLVNNTSTLFPPHAPLIKAEHIGRFETGMQGVEDWLFWVTLAAQGIKFCYIDEPLVWYRHSAESMSKDTRLMTRSRLAAAQALRNLNLPPSIDREYIIAGRHHALAVVLWEYGQRSEARAHFRKAMRIDPRHRAARRLLMGMSYLFPSHIADGLLHRILKLKK